MLLRVVTSCTISLYLSLSAGSSKLCTGAPSQSSLPAHLHGALAADLRDHVHPRGFLFPQGHHRDDTGLYQGEESDTIDRTIRN